MDISTKKSKTSIYTSINNLNAGLAKRFQIP